MAATACRIGVILDLEGAGAISPPGPDLSLEVTEHPVATTKDASLMAKASKTPACANIAQWRSSEYVLLINAAVKAICC